MVSSVINLDEENNNACVFGQNPKDEAGLNAPKAMPHTLRITTSEKTTTESLVAIFIIENDHQNGAEPAVSERTHHKKTTKVLSELLRQRNLNTKTLSQCKCVFY